MSVSYSINYGSNVIIPSFYWYCWHTWNTTFDYESLILNYKPSIQFEKGTDYFPVDFYFDHDTDITNNRENYDDGMGDYNLYLVYAHAEEYYDSIWHVTYIIVEYWYYYASETLDIPWWLYPHEHDWELHLEIQFIKSTEKPVRARAGAHGFFHNGIMELIEKDGSHPKIYVRAWKHDAYLHKPLDWSRDGFYLRYYNYMYTTNFVDNCLGEITSNGVVYCHINYEGAHVYWDSFSRNYWPKYYESVGVAPWHRYIWTNLFANTY